MSDNEENKSTGCGDPNCPNCGPNGTGRSWEDGMDDTFDKVMETTSKIVEKGENPIAVCVFVVGDKGSLLVETAGAGPKSLIELILSEVALQVSDHLHERAEKSPELQSVIEKAKQMMAAQKPADSE